MFWTHNRLTCMDPLDGSYINRSAVSGWLVQYYEQRLAYLETEKWKAYLNFTAACVCNARPGRKTWMGQSVKDNWTEHQLDCEQNSLYWSACAGTTVLLPAASPDIMIKHCGLKTGLLKAVGKKLLTQDGKAVPAFRRIHIFHSSKPYNAIVCFLHSFKIFQSISFCLN